MTISKWLAAGVAIALASSLLACSAGRSQRRPKVAAAAVPPAASTTTPADTAAGFLAAWQAGNTVAAAGFTDTPGAAKVLDDLQTALGVEQRLFTPQPVAPGEMTVPFTAKLTLKGAGEWTYSSSIPISAAGNHFVVTWSPSVIHPQLTATRQLRLGPAQASSTSRRSVLDRNGQVLSATTSPSLANILAQLIKTAPAPTVHPTSAALVVQLFDSATGQAIDLPGLVSPPAAPPADGITTTLDAAMQATAEKAVLAAAGPAAGLVVLQASTGQIRAIASKQPLDRQATTPKTPGSTMKILVAAALLRSGLSPDSKVPCPASYVVPGSRNTVHNISSAETNPDASLEYDLAKSCNTAFVQAGLDRLSVTSIVDEATNAFGIAKLWDIGLRQPTQYATVPRPASDTKRSEDLIGLGDSLASPLALASVAATVATGSFNQPALLADVPDRATAEGLSGPVASGLRRMMKAAVANGTATTLRGDVGAKTGTSGSPANVGWMMAFRGDYATACDVTGLTNSATGNEIAGPVIAQMFAGLPA